MKFFGKQDSCKNCLLITEVSDVSLMESLHLGNELYPLAKHWLQLSGTHINGCQNNQLDESVVRSQSSNNWYHCQSTEHEKDSTC